MGRNDVLRGTNRIFCHRGSCGQPTSVRFDDSQDGDVIEMSAETTSRDEQSIMARLTEQEFVVEAPIE